ncbi:MAG TPA: hypothetical protein VIJ94_10305 [Caulobacteraceae bacterium]
MESVSMRVDYDEVDEAARELAHWNEHREELPGHLRQRIMAMEPARPRSIFAVERAGDHLVVGLTPEVRALLASLRAHRR